MAELPDPESSLRKGDPGWNDPPMFLYDSRPVYNNVKRPSLTKRVGLSWDAVPGSTSPRPTIAGAAPPCLNNLPPVHSTPQIIAQPPEVYVLKSADELTPTELNAQEITLESVSCILDELIDQLFAEKEKEKLDIRKRLSLIETMWKEDKFPSEVKDKIHKICSAVKDGELEVADQLQRSLMVDHSSLCCLWMAAVRKLIAEKRSISC